MRAAFLSAAGFLFLAPLDAQQQGVPPAWKFYQEIKAGTPGVYKYKLPLEAADEAMPTLADIRVLDTEGKEVPYMLETARPALVIAGRLPDFKSRMEGNMTVLTAGAGTAGYMDCVALETPALSFIKPADVYVSMDEKQWTKAAEGVPVFRQYCNSENLRVDITPVLAKYIKVVVDDSRAAPVPFTGLKARVLPRVPASLETLTAAVISKEDYASSSRLSVRLPARNLFVFAVELAVSDKLFSRNVSVSARSLEDGRLVSKQLACDTIFTTDAAGSPASRTKVPVYAQFQGTDEMVLDVDNGNSPPLEIKSVNVVYAPVYVVFQARSAGAYRLLFANRRAPARIYDLSDISGYLTGKEFSSPAAGGVELNPAFAEAEALPKLAVFGGPIDTAKWLYKTPVSVERSGVQGLELNFQVISRAGRDLSDLRLVSDSRQVPYILDRDYTIRNLPVSAEKGEGPASVSVWKIKLPCKNFPLSQLTAAAPDMIFQRRVILYEAASDERGRSYRRGLGSAVWSNSGRGAAAAYFIGASGTPSGDELELEVENGDNKPLELSGFKLYYPVSRLIFKWKGDGGLWLYYGNREARYPAYDISLAAPELLREEKQTARLEGESGENQGWGNFKLSTALSKAAFWTVLAAVAALLIFLIVRLLPPPPQTK
ncbi:MAG: hypothetical protein HY796_12045 [Elusimicrobia bacterium]|nr:hypothetical protein [Elusimicrobiota bacterium]